MFEVMFVIIASPRVLLLVRLYNNNNNNKYKYNNNYQYYYYYYLKNHHQSVLLKGRSFIASAGTKVAVLPKAGLSPQSQEPRLQFCSKAGLPLQTQ